MDEGLRKRAKQFLDLLDDRDTKQTELRNLKAEAFGTEEKETEARAREFFEDVAVDVESSRTQQIDELEAELDELQQRIETTQESLLEELTDLRLPLEQNIQQTDDGVQFPYTDSIPDHVLDAIETVLATELDGDEVHIDTEAIIAKTDDIDEAIDSVQERIEEIRVQAGTRVDVEEYVENIHERDAKVAKTLYILLVCEEPLTKKELEHRIGAEDGALRGQLYYVLDNDPYLQKNGQAFSLTQTGTEVMRAYIDRYGTPDGLPEDVATQSELTEVNAKY